MSEQENDKAAKEMKRAIDKTIDAEKNNGHFGNDTGKKEAAEILKDNAEKDTGRKASR